MNKSQLRRLARDYATGRLDHDEYVRMRGELIDAIVVGETSIEYLKRINPKWRVFLAVEGAQDEWEGITELQWHFRPDMFLKLNNAFGLTSKAEDWAPEVGIMMSF